MKYTFKNNIFIASKGRAHKCITADFFNQHLLSVNLVVEPQDWFAYYKEYNEFHNIIVLPENDMGLGYVRNYIHKYAQDKTWANFYWMLDDDVKFNKVVAGKIKPVDDLNFFDELISTEESKKFAQLSFEYQQFAWSAEKIFTDNSYCDVAVAINLEKTNKFGFDEETGLKVDRDFTMECLYRGHKTRRYNHICMTSPSNGSNDGGLKPIYAQSGKELEDCKKMVKKWGESICNIQTKPNGRTDLKILWKNLSSHQNSLF